MAVEPLVLVVEDSPSVLALLVHQLTSAGFRTRPATTAREAVQLARRERPDLILTDVLLPDHDGAAMMCCLRNQDGFEDVPVILLSSLPLAQLEERMEDYGAQGILEKPCTSIELVRCVKNLISARNASAAGGT